MGRPWNAGPTPDVKLRAAELERDVLRLRSQRMQWWRVAQETGRSVDACREAWARGFKRIVEPEVKTIRAQCAAELDMAFAAVAEFVVKPQPVVRSGKVVTYDARDANGRIMIDEKSGKPIQVALVDVRALNESVTTLVAVQESYRRLTQADPPKRLEHSGPEGGPIPVEVTQERLDAIAARIRAVRPGSLADVVDTRLADTEPAALEPPAAEAS